MPWSLKVGKIAGTEILIHVTFLLFLAWIWVVSYMAGGAEAAWNGLIFLVLLFLCVLLHEYGHILTARAFGIPTRDVTLLPIGGVARLERFPEEPWQEFLIAIAGPMVNVAIVLVLMAVAGADPSPRQLEAMAGSKVSMVDRLAAVNVVLAVFNLIPAFPMDGGRVLRALLARRLGYVRATEIAANIGQWCAFAFGFIGLFYNPILVFIAIFIYLAAASEGRLAQLRGMSSGVPVTAAMVTEFKGLDPADRIDDAIDTLLRTSQNEFPVLDHGRLVGVLSRSDMIKALKQDGPNAKIADVMTRDVPTIGDRRFLDEAFRILMEKSAPAVGVVDAYGRLLGLITSETVGEMLMVRDAMPKGFRFGDRTRTARI